MDDGSAHSSALAWPAWLAAQGLDRLQPKRWFSTNYTHQQMQAALAGQGVALARLALVHDGLARGELVEPFGPACRLWSQHDYWLVPLGGSQPPRPEQQAFTRWVLDQAAATRQAIGDHADPDSLAHAD